MPSEETINEILDRYKEINEHAASYTWKRLGKPLGIKKYWRISNILNDRYGKNLRRKWYIWRNRGVWNVNILININNYYFEYFID